MGSHCLLQTAMARTYKTLLNNSGKSGHLCLVPDLRGNAFSFSPLRMMFAVSLSYMAFIRLRYIPSMGFPGGTSGKEPACQCRRCKRPGLGSWVRKISWRRALQPTLVFLPRESHGQRSLEGYSPEGHKELDMTEET